MDQPIYVPPAFPTPLAPPPEPKSSNAGKLVAAAALVAFATMGFIGKAVVRSLRSGGPTLGRALRAVADYRGEIPTPDRGTAAVEGQTRQYFHANGAILVETICFTTYSMCVGQEDLIARTDAAVMQHLDEDTVDALLPPGGECEATGAPIGGRNQHLTLCRLEGDLVITVMRLSLAATREQLRRFVDSGEAKELAKEIDGR